MAAENGAACEINNYVGAIQRRSPVTEGLGIPMNCLPLTRLRITGDGGYNLLPQVEVACQQRAQPAGSTRTYYYNEAANLMLLKVEDTSGNVWYPICQQFDANERVIFSASSAAVASVNEALGSLFTLQASSGKIRAYQYDGNGNRTLSGLQQGASGPLVVLNEWTYGTRTVGGASI